jgi:hypothetical protein
MKKMLLPALLALLALPVFAGESPMKPGLWEITAQTDMPGMPYKMPPMTMKRCITPEMLAKNQGLDEQKTPPGTHCERTGMKFSGNKAEWGMSCTGKSKMSGHGTMTWDSANSYHGENHITMDMDGRTTTMTQILHGKRVGDCKK